MMELNPMAFVIWMVLCFICGFLVAAVISNTGFNNDDEMIRIIIEENEELRERLSTYRQDAIKKLS